MHWVCAPPAHAQQSELTVHFSYSWAQPLTGGTHVYEEPPSDPGA